MILIQAAGFVGFHILFLLVFGCSLQIFFSKHGVTSDVDVILSWPFIRPLEKTGGKNLHDWWNLLKIPDCRPFSILKTLTGSRAVTKHGFLFWAQRKPNARLEIYKAFQDRLTILNRLIGEIYWKYRTAGHLVFSKPWPVTGHIATANKSDFDWSGCPGEILVCEFSDSLCFVFDFLRKMKCITIGCFPKLENKTRLNKNRKKIKAFISILLASKPI